MTGRHRPDPGFSLIELIMAMLIFSVVSAVMYSTFITVMGKTFSLSTENSLAEKGQRILSFLEEDLRMAGFLLAPEALIPYCPGADNGTGGRLPSSSPVLSHTDGNPYDSLTLLTAIPIELSEQPGCKKLFVPGVPVRRRIALPVMFRAPTATGSTITSPLDANPRLAGST